MQPQPDPIVNAHRSVGSGSTLPFRMKMKRAAHGYLCDAARCEDEGEVHYGKNTDPGRAYGRESTRLCGRYLKLFYRWGETQ